MLEADTMMLRLIHLPEAADNVISSDDDFQKRRSRYLLGVFLGPSFHVLQTRMQLIISSGEIHTAIPVQWEYLYRWRCH